MVGFELNAQARISNQNICGNIDKAHGIGKLPALAFLSIHSLDGFRRVAVAQQWSYLKGDLHEIFLVYRSDPFSRYYHGRMSCF